MNFFNLRRVLVSVAMLSALVMPGSGFGRQETNREARLRLNVQLLPPLEDTSEPPALLVSVLNLGLEGVWLSRRFAFNYSEAPPPFRDLWLEVKDRATGKLSPFSGEARVGFTDRASLVVLDPGQSVGTWLSLGPIFGMVHGHSYEVTVKWRNVIPERLRPPRGAIAFSGELVAARLIVEY